MYLQVTGCDRARHIFAVKLKLPADVHGVFRTPCTLCVAEHVRKARKREGKKGAVCKQSLRFKRIVKLTAQLAAMFSCCLVENSCHDGA